MSAPLGSITDALLECRSCGKISRVGDCEPDIDGDGRYGCPVPDCGGVMGEMQKAGGAT